MADETLKKLAEQFINAGKSEEQRRRDRNASSQKIAQLFTLLNPELARALLQSLEVIPKLERENKELRQTLEATTVELNRVNDRRIEAEARVAALKAGIVAYRVGGWWPAAWEKAHGSLVSPTAPETTG